MSNLRARRWLIAWELCAVALLICTLCPIQAQLAGAGNIQGTVTDATGAVVPSSKVTLTDTSSGVALTTQTDNAGVYLFPNVKVSTYSLKIVAAGFQSYVQTNIVLEVGSNISISPALKAGTTDQTVEVHADALGLQTEDASFKQTIDESALHEMPLNGREMTALITLSGGSSPAPGGDFVGTKYSYQTISVSVAGGMGNTTEWKLDGGDNNDYMGNGNLPFPFPDAVEEFSVESIAENPQNTLHSGGMVNVVTKSGTNTYHGSAFEFIRNNYIDATNFFAASKDTLHQNQFGGTFGGRLLPWTRKKLFAFTAYQRWIETSASSKSTAYVPTADNLAGDWSRTDPPPGAPANSCGSPQQLYDPLTGAAIPGNKYTTPPAYNSAALNLYKYLPTSTSGARVASYDPNCGTVRFSIPTEEFDNQFVTREDWTINAKNNLYARYFIDGYQAPAFFSPTNILVTTTAGNYERVQTATAGLASTISSSLINNLHVSVTKRVNNRSSASGINGDSIGITMYNQVPSSLFLTVSTSGKNHGWNAYCGTCSPGHFNVSNEGVSDDLTWVSGLQQIVVGGEFTRVQYNEVAATGVDGSFTFNGEFSGNGPAGGNVRGDANLDFLWGAMSGFQQSMDEQEALRASIPSLYAVDTFQANKRLTIVAGIRWAPEFFPHDYFNRGAVFNLNDFLANRFSAIYPSAPPGIFFYGDQGVPKSFTKSSPLQFNPNLGATWDPFGKGDTVIRGGLGLIYDEANIFISNSDHLVPPFATASSPNISGPVCFSEPWLAGGTGYGCAQTGGANTSPYPEPPVPAPSQAVFPAQSQYVALPRSFHESDALQWTFSIQHQFKGGWQAQADYIGSKTSHMQISTPLNPAVYTPGIWGTGGTGCGPVQTSGAAAVAGKTVGGGAPGTACSTTGNSQARFKLVEANPLYGNLLGGGGFNGSYGATGSFLINDNSWANYSGLVLTLQHRISSTFNMMSNYTWSKCLNVADAFGDAQAVKEEAPDNLGLDYGRCGSDYRNIFNSTLVARSAFRSIHGIAGYLVNDWELAPLLHITSGAPVNITDSADISLTDIGNDRPNAVPGVNPVHEVKILNSSTATQATREYLNPAAFCSVASTFNPCANPVAAGTYGNLHRNSLNGPMFFQLDSQISRIWRMGERFTLDTRLEAFNVLNHPDFSNPDSGNPSSSSFGLITGQANGARLLQGAVKVIF